jgi:hypothetical protein
VAQARCSVTRQAGATKREQGRTFVNETLQKAPILLLNQSFTLSNKRYLYCVV